MSSLVLPERKILKPPLGARLNPYNKYSRRTIAMYLFNEGGGDFVYNVVDNTVSNKTAGTGVWTEGKFGKGHSFNANTNFMHSVKYPKIDSIPMSLIVWCRSNQLSTDHIPICVNKDSTPVRCILDLNGLGSGEILANQRGSATVYATATKSMEIGVWHQCVGVFVSQFERHAYIDGGNKGSNYGDSGGMSAIDTIQIGCDWSQLYDFNGDIDHIVIIKGALSDNEVAELYRSPFIMFDWSDIILLSGDPLAIYSRGSEMSLPTDNDNDLENAFTESEYSDIAADDSVRVLQSATDEFSIFLFKDKNTSQQNISVTWNGQSDVAPTQSTVYLQIFNRNSNVWETLNSNSVAAANVDFTLIGTKTTNLSHYFDDNNRISCRVYQEAK